MKRVILHCDINNCFASIELLSHPEWRGLPMAVCGSVEDRHGIVLAKSEEAKKMGVKTAEPIWQAKNKCPNLIIAPPHYSEYIKYSKLSQEIYSSYTDKVESFGLDECWLDCTQSTNLFGDGELIAHTIRERMKRELGLTISVGVSFNKIFAKLGSDLKKPDAVSVICEESFKDTVWNLKASELLGVGRATANKLADKGIFSIGDIANSNPEFLKKLLGVVGVELWNYANGRDYSEVNYLNSHIKAKSVGHGITCKYDLVNDTEVNRVFLELAQDVSSRLISFKLQALGIEISIRDTDLITVQFQSQLPFATRSSVELCSFAMDLFKKNYKWRKYVRSLTIRAINLVSENMSYQLDILNDYVKHEKLDKLESSIYKIRKKYNEKSATYATLLTESKIPNNKNLVASFPIRQK